MRGSSFGKLLSISTFGESHGEALGAIVDGVPAGIEVSVDDLHKELLKRAPGQKGTTSRVEKDRPEILSGVFEGKTLGTPICVIVRNEGQRSSDYDKLKNQHRPGHADRTTIMKYGVRDHRGGGRSSGRETVSRVIGGYFASLIIPEISVKAFPTRVGEKIIEQQSSKLSDEVLEYLDSIKKESDSVGGVVSIIVENCPGGLGEPVFDKLKADFAKALLSIGGCVSFSYGAGEELVNSKGSDASSAPEMFGGIEGGISNGEVINMQIGFKPVSTVGEKAREGRHDPCIIPRVLPVVEAMVKMVLADHFLRQKAYGDGE